MANRSSCEEDVQQTRDVAADTSTSSLVREITTRQTTHPPPNKTDRAVAATMALSSGKKLGRFFTSAAKGALSDIPLAVAEGSRALPRVWGGRVNDYGAVTDWQSGAMVAGKSFALGIGGGFRDFVMNPVEGARSKGVLGAAQGVATGTGSLLTSVTTGSLGLAGYSGRGIPKSLHAWMHSSTARRVAEAKAAEGRWGADRLSEAERAAIEAAFYEIERRET